MYLRRSTVRKAGKTHTYWRLVRSVRHGSKVRQETVAYLGDLNAKGRASASALARHFLGDKVDGQRELFEDRSPAEPVGVRIKDLRVERSRAFGGVWLGWQLWRALGLDDFCVSVRSPRERALDAAFRPAMVEPWQRPSPPESIPPAA